MAELTMYEIKDKAYRGIQALEDGREALARISTQYDFNNFEPDPRKALEYMQNMCKSDREKDIEGERSCDYLLGYNNIMWLTRVAYDYMSEALSIMQVINGGAENE